MNELLLALLGLVAGTYGTIIGAGGGFIMVPMLTLFLLKDTSAAHIAAASLFAVLATGISATYAYGRMKRVDFKTAGVFVIATVPGAILGVHIVSHLHRNVFEGIFGGILTAIALYLFLVRRDYSKAKQRTGKSTRTIVDAQGKSYTYSVNYWIGGGVAFVVGVLSGMLGIGGGLMMVPTMVLLLGMPVPIAVGTSQALLLCTALSGTLTHLTAGNLWGEWRVAPILAIGTVVGAQIGARISPRLRDTMIARLLSLALVVVGVRLLIAAFRG